MLTLAEIESTLQIQFETRLEDLDEKSLRALIANPPALRRLAPPHLGAAQRRRIAEATLAEMIERRQASDTGDTGSSAKPAPTWPWAPLFAWVWTPLR